MGSERSPSRDLIGDVRAWLGTICLLAWAEACASVWVWISVSWGDHTERANFSMTGEKRESYFCGSGLTAAPLPSLRVWKVSTARLSKVSTSPLGQRT